MSTINENLKLIPSLPGSYQMYDKNDIIIYVGKAKNLKKRVSSYFNRTLTGKTKKIKMSQIWPIYLEKTRIK